MIFKHRVDEGHCRRSSKCVYRLFVFHFTLIIGLKKYHYRIQIYMFKCDNCDYKTNRKYNYDRHIKGCYSKIKCIYCGSLFIIDKKLEIHMENCDYKQKSICYMCNKKFSSIGNLNKHLKKCKSTTYECLFCEKLFSTTNELKKHTMLCVHEVTKFDQYINDTSITDTNNITNDDTTNKLLNFGKEDLSGITVEKLRQCFLNPRNAISNLTRMMHFDKNHPENANIRI